MGKRESAFMVGGFGRERSFSGPSAGEDNGGDGGLDVLFQTALRAFLQHRGKTGIMPVEYPM